MPIRNVNRQAGWFLWMAAIFLPAFLFSQNCDNNGNIVIFSNYDGGYLNIEVDIDIPNLKIGIASYEPTQVNITGAFAGNVTEVHYAGYFPLTGTGNLHCDDNLIVGSVNPLPNAQVTIVSIPPVTLIATAYDTTTIPGFPLLIGENSGIIGCHTCNTTEYTGGDNTSDQIIDYFATYFNGSVRFLKTQYGCWCGTQDMSQPNTCCQEITTSGGSVTLLANPMTICNGQPVTLSAFGNFDTYTWSTGENTPAIQVATPGTYTLSATNDCGSFTGSITVAACPQEICSNGIDDDGDGLTDFLDPDCPCNPLPDALSIIQSGTPCDPLISLQADMIAGAQYQWSLDGDPLPGEVQSELLLSASADANGIYTVFMIDPNGQCASSDPVAVEFAVPVVLTADITGVSCAGESDGSVALMWSPAGNYTFQWLDSQGTLLGSDATLTAVSAGMYSLTVTDAYGCQHTGMYAVNEPAPLQLAAAIEPPGCDGDTLGMVALTATGGMAPYLYDISGGFSSADGLFELPPGNYTATATDANGCITLWPGIVIESTDTPLLSIIGPDHSVPLGEVFVLTAVSDISLADVMLAWQPADWLDCADCAVVQVTAVGDTLITLTATDTNGCVGYAQYQLIADKSVSVFVPNIFNPDFSGINDVFRLFTGQGVEQVVLFRVYDRWGNLMCDDITGWNGTYKGKEAPAGVYAWYAELLYKDGHRDTLKGDVTLLR